MTDKFIFGTHGRTNIHEDTLLAQQNRLVDLADRDKALTKIEQQLEGLAQHKTLSEAQRQQLDALRNEHEKVKTERKQAEAKLQAARARAAAQGKTRHIAHETKEWRVTCTGPDFCKVDKNIVAFDSTATLDQQRHASPNVKARNSVVYRQGDLFQVVLGNAGAHVVGGTSQESGFVKILDGKENVKVNGLPTALDNSRCLINCNAQGQGGAMGRLMTVQKSVSSPAAPAPNAPPPGQRTSPKLEELKRRRAEVQAGMLNVDKLDEVVDFKRTNGMLDGLIDKLKGEPGTLTDYLAQGTRGVVRFVKDLGTGISEMAYEGIKNVPKSIENNFTLSGWEMRQLDAQIMMENINLGNITPGTVGNDVLNVGKNLVKPVTDPWNKGQHVEAVTRGVVEVGTLFGGSLTKLAKAGNATKMTEATKAVEAAKAVDTAKTAEATQAAKPAEAAKAADATEATKGGKPAESQPPPPGDGVHIQASRSAKLRQLLEKKWGGRDHVERALQEKRADPKLNALLTDDEYLSLRAYTSGLFRPINGALRSGNVAEWETLVDEACSAMDKMSANGFEYIGDVRRDTFFTEAQIDEFFRQPDKTFTDPGFLSTTTDSAGVFPGNTTIHIDSKSGVLIESVSELPHEAEVLFKPGTQFYVEGIENISETKRVIFLKEM